MNLKQLLVLVLCIPIGIAIRHAITLGCHIQNPETNHSNSSFKDIIQARSIAWVGVWMLEKYALPFPSYLSEAYIHRHITRVLGQPSAVRESDIQPISVPILPSVEYCLWPASENPTIPKLTSYCMSNFQLSCDLLRIVTPALDKMYVQVPERKRGMEYTIEKGLPSFFTTTTNPVQISSAISCSVSFGEKEDQVTKTHVAMSEFYNNLPSPLRLPSTATKQLPPHVYQFKYVSNTKDA